MTEIEEGDQVVTPDGGIDDVVRVTEIPDPCGPQLWLKERELCLGQDKLVKTSEPIRVRVSREKQAEDLVALAEEYGFEVPKSFVNGINYPESIHFQLDPIKRLFIDIEGNHNLTYAQDLSHIEAWLQANAESEDDECVCDENNQVTIAKDKEVPCPDCTDESDNTMSVDDDDERWIQNDTDESEEYDEPRPEDEEWLQQVKVMLESDELNDEEKLEKSKRLGFWDDKDDKKRNPALDLVNRILDLESELQDVREERDEWKELYENAYKNGCDRADEAIERKRRIEEAREKLQHHLPRLNEIARDIDHNGAILRLQGIFDDLNELEILSEDSDEGE